MSNLLWKERKKKMENKKKKKKVQDNGKRTEEKKLEHCWTHHIEKKKERKERTFFSKIDSTYIEKKIEKRTEHLWTVIVILFWLFVKWKFVSLFELKGDIRTFFPVSYYEIWWKPLSEDFILG